MIEALLPIAVYAFSLVALYVLVSQSLENPYPKPKWYANWPTRMCAIFTAATISGIMLTVQVRMALAFWFWLCP
jgi:hypothetical protein